MIRRNAPPKRSPVKRVNAARKRREFARAYGSPARVEWVQSLPCLVNAFCAGGVQNVHFATRWRWEGGT